MSTPPWTTAHSEMRPPTTKRYQDSRLRRGKATSLAPIISGMRKLPRTPGMPGIMKKNTIITPCVVNILLYVSDWKKSPAGVRSSRRIAAA